VTRPSSSQRTALVVVCGILALTFLDTTVVSVALGSVESDLHVGVTGLQWVVDAYALTFGSLMLTGGTLGDRFGRRRVMLVGVAVFTVASMLAAIAHAAILLIVARALMGVGAAGSEPGTLSVLRQVFPERSARARAIGLWAGVSCLGLALGPIVGGVLVGLWDWRAVFWFNVVAGLGLLLAARRYVPESSDPDDARVDVPGQVLGVVTLAAVIIAVIQGEISGYSAPAIVSLFVLSACSGVAFVVVELRVRSPMLNLRYFRLPRFTAALVVAFAIYFGTFSIFVFTSLYLQDVDHYSGFRTAVLYIPMAVTMVLGAAGSAALIARSRGRWIMTAGCGISAAGILASERLITAHPPFLSLTATLALTGLGFGAAIVPVTTSVLDVVPAHHSGMAAAATNTARALGVVFGVAILGALINAHLTGDLLAKMRQLGVPPAFRSLVLDAVRHGVIPSGGSSQGGTVHRVVAAAFQAFRAGLTAALLTSVVLITLAGGIAALVAAKSGRGALEPAAPE
jgi:EmrB/QacA subfamily drug resistance transporter